MYVCMYVCMYILHITRFRSNICYSYNGE